MSAYDFLCDVRQRQRAALYTVSAESLDEPVAEPITLAQARAHCRVDVFEEGSPPEEVSDDDDWFTDIGIPAAREYCEATLGRALAERTMRVTTNTFPINGANAIPLPFGPVRSIVSVIYRDEAVADAAYEAAYVTAYDEEFNDSGDEEAAIAAGVAAGDIAYEEALEQTMANADYAIDTSTTPHRLTLAYGASWPTARGDPGAVVVEYVVGYDSEGSPAGLPIPKTAKAAILNLLTHLYEHRGDESINVPPMVDQMLVRVAGRENLGFA